MTLALAAILLSFTPSVPSAPTPLSTSRVFLGDDLDDELEELLAEERAEANRLRRRGRISEARRLLSVHLDDDEGDWRSRALFALCLWDAGERERAQTEQRRALRESDQESKAAQSIRMDLATELTEIGKSEDALRLLDDAGDLANPRLGWLIGIAKLESGDRAGASDAFQKIVYLESTGMDWIDLLYRAKCERATGQLEAASRTLVAADALSRAGAGTEPDVLVELANIYFEADGEVARDGSSTRLPSALYREALELHPTHPGALLGNYELHLVNWRRTRSARSFLVELLDSTPDSIPGLIALTHSHLKQGELVAARQRLGTLEREATGRRDVRALRAALEYIEDKPESADRSLEVLTEQAPWDSSPERRLGSILVGLYRFADALPFLESAVARNPGDWLAMTRLGECLANTGDEQRALDFLGRAEDIAEGRQDAWRNNQKLVLTRIAETFETSHGSGELSYAWPADGSEVLKRVLPKFYAESREQLAERYGFTPGPTLIEVFDRHRDFSVRSTGFEGFPALGVCFGSVVTALSPLCEMRGQFSWAETSYHEFSHVIHLGLTRNRCPRWITEGLATWEEEQRDASWVRPLRRELVDSFANEQIIGVRNLNRAFSGPRIIWAYYQGGLLCDLLIDDYGFPAMVKLLEAFNEGRDLDGALDFAYGLTPEELDDLFQNRVALLVSKLRVEPRHGPDRVRLLRLGLDKEHPGISADIEDIEDWSDAWCTVAWSAWQMGRGLDAEEALRVLGDLHVTLPRALFLRGEMALAQGQLDAAQAHYSRAFELGGEDYRARMALGNILMRTGKKLDAQVQFQAAESAFPGWEDKSFNAELHLMEHYRAEGREDESMAALERWLRWNSGEDQKRLEVAHWRLKRGDYSQALKLFTSAVEVDPFRASAHRGRGEALFALGDAEGCIYAYETALLVPTHLDSDYGASGASPLAGDDLAAVLERAKAARSAIEDLLKRARKGV